jgi:indole-3-glycerol phosphate synthase
MELPGGRNTVAVPVFAPDDFHHGLLARKKTPWLAAGDTMRVSLMVRAIPDVLARIVDSKRAALPRIAANRDALEQRAAARTGFRDFRAGLLGKRPAIIAEVKKASPSKGVFADRFDPAAIARAYASGGAAALSVLTDAEFFQGSLGDLESARAAVAIPVLRKDFTLDEVHVLEAAAHGADAILLIAALLDETELRKLRELAARYRMASIVEVHDAAELDAAIGSGAEIIGVNNRNLHTFEVTLETSLSLASKIPSGAIKVSESGIDSRASIVRLQAAGFDAVLVGEHLMRAPDAGAALRALLQ